MTKQLEPIAVPDEVVSQRLEKVRALYRLGRALREVRVAAANDDRSNER